MYVKRLMIIVLSALFTLLSAKDSKINKAINQTMNNFKGACVFINCDTKKMSVFNTKQSETRVAPCSSFKIWNTLIGLECGLVDSVNERFYTWDGKKRFLDVWNQDQTLKEAFQRSCVPAYQNLAQKIGSQRMQKWIDTIGYGDRDISSGIDIFWLPREGKKSILISPKEQATLIMSLVNNELPFQKKSLNVLRGIMLIEETANGSFYGKTGSGMDVDGDPKNDYGWFVGYVKGKNDVYSFACLVKGESLMGSDAKKIVRSILTQNKLL